MVSEQKSFKTLRISGRPCDWMTDFERVWQQILEVARTIGEITTLTHKVSNQVVSVAEEAIVVKSKRTEQPRQLAKSMFRRVYDTLTIHRQIMCKRDEDVLVSHQRIIMAFLAHLPNVEYSIRPQTLYLMPTNTHPLGTMREHIEGKQRVDAHKGHLSCRELKEIPEKLEVFIRGLEEFLSSGAQVIEKAILEKLYSSFGFQYQNKEGYTFIDYVTELKKKLA